MQNKSIGIYPNNTFSLGIGVNILSYFLNQNYKIKYNFEDRIKNRHSLNLLLKNSPTTYDFEIKLGDIENINFLVYTLVDSRESAIDIVLEKIFQLTRNNILNHKGSIISVIVTSEKEVTNYEKIQESQTSVFCFDEQTIERSSSSSISIFDFSTLSIPVPIESEYYMEMIKLCALINKNIRSL